LNPRGLIVDLFAGGGGASVALAKVFGEPDVAVNHDKTALAVHRRNHPTTLHLESDVFEVDPITATGGRRVFVLWASPDCTHFSIAKGNVPRSQNIRSLAWVVVEWARKVAPQIIFLENVREFTTWGPLGKRGRPLKAKMGTEFKRWKKALEALGYAVDHRVLDASDYGAPTRRKRLFLVARRDGQAIAWPEPTHGDAPGLLPYRAAAECIDWSKPCPSIFGRKKPLCENTMMRIAEGIRRFVIDNPRPFIVKSNHGGKGRREFRGQTLDEPLTTITSARRGHALVAPTLVQTGYGERPGQRPRCMSIEQPIGTIVSGGTGGAGLKHGLVSAFVARHFGDPKRVAGGGKVIGSSLEEPLRTVTARDHHSLVAASLVKLRGSVADHPGCSDVEEPMPTVSAQGNHLAEVRAFLVAYYGAEKDGQDLGDPMRTIRGAACFGLVVVEGVEYEIVDIGFRMIMPDELILAQFGDYAEGYDIFTDAKTLKAQTKIIGNSVSPPPAIALLSANAPREATASTVAA
jgi:DNA (cytosine-5)-methyltransferase 1